MGKILMYFVTFVLGCILGYIIDKLTDWLSWILL